MFARSLTMITRRSLLNNSAVGAFALAAALATRELPVLADDAIGEGARDHNHNGRRKHKNRGRNRDRKRRTNRRRRSHGNGNGGLAGGMSPVLRDIDGENHGDRIDNLEQKRKRRRNRKERRRDRRRRRN
jgi:hypothetical protein